MRKTSTKKSRIKNDTTCLVWVIGTCKERSDGIAKQSWASRYFNLLQKDNIKANPNKATKKNKLFCLFLLLRSTRAAFISVLGVDNNRNTKVRKMAKTNQKQGGRILTLVGARGFWSWLYKYIMIFLANHLVPNLVQSQSANTILLWFCIQNKYTFLMFFWLNLHHKFSIFYD